MFVDTLEITREREGAKYSVNEVAGGNCRYRRCITRDLHESHSKTQQASDNSSQDAVCTYSGNNDRPKGGIGVLANRQGC